MHLNYSIKSVFILLGIMLCVPAKALSGDKKLVVRNRDTTYIGIPRRDVSVRLHTVNKFHTFRFLSGDPEIANAKYSPNDWLGVGVGLFYKSTGVWLGISPKSFQRENDLKGTSRRIDLQLNQYGRRFMTDAYLQYYKGFYLANAENYNLGSPANPYVIRPDISTLSLGVNTYHIFNWDKCSARAAFIQTAYQKKSAGSALLGGNFSTYRIKADSGLFPVSLSNHIGEHKLTDGSFVTLSVGAGYMHNFVWKNWCLNFTILGGPALMYSKYTLEDGTGSTILRASVRVHGRSALSYNAEHFFSGITFIGDQYNLPLKETSITYRLGNIRLFVGYRLGKG